MEVEIVVVIFTYLLCYEIGDWLESLVKAREDDLD